MDAQSSLDPKAPDNRNPDWLPAYRAALLELDPQKMEERIRTARSAIMQRMNVLAQDHGGDIEEQQAITDALNALSMLERESGHRG